MLAPELPQSEDLPPLRIFHWHQSAAFFQQPAQLLADLGVRLGGREGGRADQGDRDVARALLHLSNLPGKSAALRGLIADCGQQLGDGVARTLGLNRDEPAIDLGAKVVFCGHLLTNLRDAR